MAIVHALHHNSLLYAKYVPSPCSVTGNAVNIGKLGRSLAYSFMLT